jgi:hypothetical protein
MHAPGNRTTGFFGCQRRRCRAYFCLLPSRQAAQDRVQVLEDQLMTERESRKAETSLLSSKLVVAQREVTSRDSAMLQLRTDAHNLQQVFWLCSEFRVSLPSSLTPCRCCFPANQARALEQELTTERLKMEDVKASFTAQLRSAGGDSKGAEERVLKAEAEAKALRQQLEATKQTAADVHVAKEDTSALRVLKIQLQKVELDKKSLQQQVPSRAPLPRRVVGAEASVWAPDPQLPSDHLPKQALL